MITVLIEFLLCLIVLWCLFVCCAVLMPPRRPR